jgi:hypothetical protein
MQQYVSNRVPAFYFGPVEVGEDRAKSEELGYAVPKVETMIFIVPFDHKGDPLTFEANSFIARKKVEARDGRYDPSWVSEFERGFKEYNEGREVQRSGTPLFSFEKILKSRRMQLSKQFPTVEDLAAVPDSGLGLIGLDGRVLRDLARAEIQAKANLAPVVEELATANETIRKQEEMISRLEERLSALENSATTVHRKAKSQ